MSGRYRATQTSSGDWIVKPDVDMGDELFGCLLGLAISIALAILLTTLSLLWRAYTDLAIFISDQVYQRSQQSFLAHVGLEVKLYQWLYRITPCNA